MTAPEAEPGFAAITGEDSRWQNRVGARIMLHVGTYRPVAKAAKVRCPLLVQVGDRDETTPPEPAMQDGRRARRAASCCATRSGTSTPTRARCSSAS